MGQRAGALGFTLGGRRWTGGAVVPRVTPRPVATNPPSPVYTPSPINPLAHSFIHPSLFLSSSWLGSLVWNCASELDETPCAGRRHAAGFLVQIHLPLLYWTRARTTSIHHTCVTPRRRRSCGAGLLQLLWLHDLEVGFVGHHRQNSCGNIPAHSVFNGMNTYATPLPYSFIE
jgi:hypothetical protein